MYVQFINMVATKIQKGQRISLEFINLDRTNLYRTHT